MRRRSMLILGIALALLFAANGWAAQERIFRFAGVSVNPTGDLRMEESETLPLGDGTTLVAQEIGIVEADSAFGFCLDFEQKLTDLVGLGVTLMYSEPDITLDATGTAQIVDDLTGTVLLEFTESASMTGSGDMMPLLIGPNFHFGPSEKVDLYAGPFIGYVFYGDVTIEGESTSVKDDFTYGAVMGLDVPFGEKGLAFSASARYMVTEAEPRDDNQALDIDPVTFLAGLGYSF